MKFNIALMAATIVGVAVAASAQSWDGTTQTQPGAPQLAMPNLANLKKVAAKQKKASAYQDLSGLIEIWMSGDYGDPADKELVAQEIKKLLEVASDRAELIQMKVAVDNKKESILKWIDDENDLVNAECEALKTEGYGNLTDDEIIKKAQADPNGIEGYGAFGIIKSAVSEIGKARNKADDIDPLSKMLAARLAVLNSGR